MTSPLPILSHTTTVLMQSIASNILSLGMSQLSFTGSTGASGNTVFTRLHRLRLGQVSSLTAKSWPLMQVFPVTTISPSCFSACRRQPLGHTMQLNSFIPPPRFPSAEPYRRLCRTSSCQAQAPSFRAGAGRGRLFSRSPCRRRTGKVCTFRISSPNGSSM